ncbi:hypothetical protein ACFLRB_05545 [Acidobacteriota bacterium]
MKTILLFNPDKFGISMAGISFREWGEECKLVVFREKRIILKKDYANTESAKRGFANRFRNDNGLKPLWPVHIIEHDYKEGKEKKESLIEQAVAYIIPLKDEEIRNLTAEGVAAAIQTDLKQLAPAFEKDQKISIPGFIKREKVYRAYFALNKGIDIAIPELSERLGFASIDEFEKEFENNIFVKPGEYKEFVKKRKDRKQ